MKKRKAGFKPLSAELAQFVANPDSYLFMNGRTVNDYYIEGSAESGLIGFRQNGRDYSLLIDVDDLTQSLRRRLIELGVEQRSQP